MKVWTVHVWGVALAALLVLLVACASASDGCCGSGYALDFGPQRKAYAYGIVSGFPSTELTVSTWIRSIDGESTSQAFTILSYATTQSDNSLWFSYPFTSLLSSSTSAFDHHGVRSAPNATWSTSWAKWTHFVVAWRSSDGLIRVWADGSLVVDELIEASVNATLPSSGSMVLGQDQDVVGGGFDPSQALRGSIDELRVYSVAHMEKSAMLAATLAPVDLGTPDPTLALYFDMEDGPHANAVTDRITGASLAFNSTDASAWPVLVPSGIPLRLGGPLVVSVAASSTGTAPLSLDLLPGSEAYSTATTSHAAQRASLGIDYQAIDATAGSSLTSGPQSLPASISLAHSGGAMALNTVSTPFMLPIVGSALGPATNLTHPPEWSFSYARPAAAQCVCTVHFRTELPPQTTATSRVVTVLEDTTTLFSLNDDLSQWASAVYDLQVVVTALPTNGSILIPEPTTLRGPLVAASALGRLDVHALVAHFAPPPDAFGTSFASFEVQFLASSGFATSLFTYVFDVVEVDDAPKFMTPPAATVMEDSDPTLIDLAVVDVDSEVYMVVISALPQHGTLYSVAPAPPGAAPAPGTVYNEPYQSWKLGEPVEQWVDSVVAFSSEYDVDIWGSRAIIGPPQSSIYGFPVSCYSSQLPNNGPEYITVRFATPVYIQSIEIHECNAGGTATALEISSSLHPETPPSTVWRGKGLTDLPAKYFVWQATDVCGLRYPVDTITLRFDTTVGTRSWGGFEAIKLVGEVEPRNGVIFDYPAQLFYQPDGDYFGIDTFSVSFTDCISISCNQPRLVGPYPFTVHVPQVADTPTVELRSLLPDALIASYVSVNASNVLADSLTIVELSIVVPDSVASNVTIRLAPPAGVGAPALLSSVRLRRIDDIDFASSSLVGGMFLPYPLPGAYTSIDLGADLQLYDELPLGSPVSWAGMLTADWPPASSPRAVAYVAVEAEPVDCTSASMPMRTLWLEAKMQPSHSWDDAVVVDTAVSLVCGSCPIGRVFNPASRTCDACPSTTYAPLGSRLCLPCPPGSSSGRGAASCAMCEAGMYAATNASVCIRCPSGTYTTGRGSSTCSQCPVNEDTLVRGATSSALCTCAPGWYRDLTRLLPALEKVTNGTVSPTSPAYEHVDIVNKAQYAPCLPCPIGAICSGGYNAHGVESQPRALPGYWIDPARPTFVMLCRTAHACPGGEAGLCAPSYGGILCGECASGHYASHDECLDCGPVPWLPLAFAVLIVVSVIVAVTTVYTRYPNAIVVFNTNQRKLREAFALLSILIEFLQVASILQSLRGWSSPFLILLYAASTLQLNIELLRLDCIFGAVGFEVVGIIVAIAPVLVGLVAALLFHITRSVIGRNFLTSIFLYLSRFMLVAVLGHLTRYFMCFQQPNDSSHWSMVSRPDIRCWVDNSRWTVVVPFAAIFLTLYATTVPTFLYYIINRMYRERSPSILYRYSSLIFSFRDGAYYTALVIVARKIAIVLVAPVIAYQIPYDAIAYASLLALLILFHLDVAALHIIVFCVTLVAFGYYMFIFIRLRHLRGANDAMVAELAEQRERERAFMADRDGNPTSKRGRPSRVLPLSLLPNAMSSSALAPNETSKPTGGPSQPKARPAPEAGMHGTFQADESSHASRSGYELYTQPTMRRDDGPRHAAVPAAAAPNAAATATAVESGDQPHPTQSGLSDGSYAAALTGASVAPLDSPRLNEFSNETHSAHPPPQPAALQHDDGTAQVEPRTASPGRQIPVIHDDSSPSPSSSSSLSLDSAST
ncbi:C-reactive protein 1.1 [Thecamonas trahens ATCC 50062]|uniref:C-reactive protein 1.1 n=1 Tax=Thecamonas trahens ATCC 50062 TaxID=461836 RepID=A0A0L0DCU4_THETB|nr:C-reactive protein 1.1 [Thecamonas trahens ATCC 50062]KNC50055.1 C-reactive protein 1.1 [Thecamonas trahens ATCC 50062]|eukprot:XP_013757220.1 C-reactive protein 1.1 [Thecamonas trahens ATCC 50062]